MDNASALNAGLVDLCLRAVYLCVLEYMKSLPPTNVGTLWDPMKTRNALGHHSGA